MKYHRCEWCARPATYRIQSGTDYERYSCGEHSRKLEASVDLDLGKGPGAPIRRHTTRSEPFALVAARAAGVEVEA